MPIYEASVIPIKYYSHRASFRSLTMEELACVNKLYRQIKNANNIIGFLSIDEEVMENVRYILGHIQKYLSVQTDFMSPTLEVDIMKSSMVYTPKKFSAYSSASVLRVSPLLSFTNLSVGIDVSYKFFTKDSKELHVPWCHTVCLPYDMTNKIFKSS